MADLTNVPQEIQDDLADLQSKFSVHQTANVLVVSAQANLISAQTAAQAASAKQQQTANDVTAAIAKLSADVAKDYADPAPTPPPAPAPSAPSA